MKINRLTKTSVHSLCPWDVLGAGHFQSKAQIEARKKANEGLRSMMGDSEQNPQEVKISEALEKVGKEHGVESVTAVALAYVIAKAPRVIPLVGGRKVEHLHDNIRALSIKLTPENLEFLESQTTFDVGFPANFVGPDPKVTGQAFGLAAASVPMAYPDTK